MPLFMRISDVEGPYSVGDLGDELFSIDSFSQAMHLPTSEGGAHARTIGTPNVGEFRVTKKVDSSTALLMRALLTAATYDQITVYDVVTESSGEMAPASTITMENAVIRDLSYHAANEVEATQELSITFDKINWAISSVDRLTGNVEPPKEYLWEAKAAGVRS